MKLNPLLVAASLAYAIPGAVLTFAPDIALQEIGVTAPPLTLWMAELLGGALLALAMLNWIQRFSIIGGLFGRPLLMTNLLALSVCFFSSVRHWRGHQGLAPMIVSLFAAILLLAFGRLFFVAPQQKVDAS